jgi:hypothetical protein
MSVASDLYGQLVVVRPPAPVTVNKAGANYKSAVPHLEYSPRAAYREWLAICDAVLEAGGDALVVFEDEDEPFLDHDQLEVDASGVIRAGQSQLGHLDQISTGRVFAANGPWIATGDQRLLAVMPHMLPHRQAEAAYFERLLADLADECRLRLDVRRPEAPWEGMADVTAVDDTVIFTHAVAGHYDQDTVPQAQRSTLEGAVFAADCVGIGDDARLFVELVHPHFHGDTVHFTARRADGTHCLVHYPGGLWGDGSARIRKRLAAPIVELDRSDAVDAYAGNSRQIGETLLTTALVSEVFTGQMQALGLEVVRLELAELFGKAGGGPGCATLYLPTNLEVPADSPLRYSGLRELAHQRATRVAERVLVDADYFGR